MRGAFERILERYGQRVQMDGAEVFAFFQPRGEHMRAEPFEMTSLGEADDRRWLYFGAAEAHRGSVATFRGERYRVESFREIRTGERKRFWWAELKKESEAAE